MFGEEALTAPFSTLSEQTLPYSAPVSMGTGWVSGGGKPLTKVTYLKETGNYYYTNEHNNKAHGWIMDFVDVALNFGTNVNADAAQTKSILEGLAGKLGYYNGLLTIDEQPVMSNDQASYMFEVVKGFTEEGNGNPLIETILTIYSCMVTGRMPMYAKDEFHMMIQAIREAFLYSSTAKGRNLKGAGQSDFFTLPVLTLVNSHIATQNCGLNPIRWHPAATLDAQLVSVREEAFERTWVHENESGLQPAYVAKEKGPFEAYLAKHAPADARTKVSLVPDDGKRDFNGHELLVPKFLTKVKEGRVAPPKVASVNNTSTTSTAKSGTKKPAAKKRKTSLKSQPRESTDTTITPRTKRNRKSVNYRGM